MFYMKNWQQVALTIAFLFALGCVAGWFLELLYRRYISKNNPERKWINPGFLTGPYLPLYGFALVTAFGLSYIPVLAVKRIGELTVTKTVLIIISIGLVMTFIEYIAGLIFIKRMKIKLWDYSKEWGNIQGIICPKFTMYWTVMAAGYYIFVQPQIVRVVGWYYNNIAFTFVVGFFFGIFVVDFCYSMDVGHSVRRFAEENGIVVKYEELKLAIDRSKQELSDRARFTLSFKSSRPLSEHLRNYADSLKSVPGTIKAVPGAIKSVPGVVADKIRDKLDD